jgi:hypothetical protein
VFGEIQGERDAVMGVLRVERRLSRTKEPRWWWELSGEHAIGRDTSSRVSFQSPGRETVDERGKR